jgi:hypothetical protein
LPRFDDGLCHVAGCGRLPEENRMMRLVSLLLVLLLGGCGTPRLEGIPLVWKPNSTLGASGQAGADIPAIKIRVVPLKDTRPNTSSIGENRETSPVRKVTTRDDVSVFVTERLKMLLANAGYGVVNSGETVVVGGEVKQFFVAETNTYESEVRLLVTVADPAGTLRWTGTTEGTAKRFGISYKADNYYEVLSDGMIEAVSSLLKDGGFQKALAGKP